MSGLFRCRGVRFLYLHWRNVGDSNTSLRLLSCGNELIVSSSFSSIGSVEECDGKQQSHSFTVHYLVNTCGLSLQSALSCSKYVTLYAPERPDSVISVLKDHGFTGDQIKRVIRSYPVVLLADATVTLVPKLEFFRSIGFSSADSAKLIASCPRILSRSLNNALMPRYDFVKGLVSKDKIVGCLKRSFWLLLIDLQKTLASNISALRSHGVPERVIKRAFVCSPLALSGTRFNENLNRVISLGFDPSKTAFMQALRMMGQLRESTWERKVENFKRWGWSEDNIFSAFRKFPSCMGLSEKKIDSTMDFLANKMGLPHSFAVHNPIVLGLSVEKRIAPRWLVVAMLVSEGVLEKEDINFAAMLRLNDERFMDKFVTRYQNDIPDLLSAFQAASK